LVDWLVMMFKGDDRAAVVAVVVDRLCQDSKLRWRCMDWRDYSARRTICGLEEGRG
jgi:hypothetical protein